MVEISPPPSSIKLIFVTPPPVIKPFLSLQHAHMKVPGSPTSENHELHDFKQEEGLVVAKATAKGENGLVHNNAMVDATFPHGTCHSHSDGIGSSILHPRTEECGKKGCQKNGVKVR